MAYAALLSLTRILEQTLRHDHLYLILDGKQDLASLLQKVSLLGDLLYNCPPINSETTESLESQIIDAAHVAEDIIELHIKNSVSASPEDASLTNKLEKVIQEIDSLNDEFMKTSDNRGIQEQQPRTWMSSGSSKKAPGKSDVIGLEYDLMHLMEELIDKSFNGKIVCIVGMSGMGKTTLARLVHVHPHIEDHFEVRAWVTLSQNYNEREILLGLLDSMVKLTDKMREENTQQLQQRLHKNLKGRRYLIVMDNVWDTKVCDYAKRLLRDNMNGSRILMTSRLVSVGHYGGSSIFKMRSLRPSDSWSLLCHKLFNGCCPDELDHIGKLITEECTGIPLAIAVMGGLLSKAPQTIHYWANVAHDIRSLVNSGGEDRLTDLLYLCYKYLPRHLKGCLIYMGIFPEGYEIPVSKLVKLWVAEGLLNSVECESREDVAEEYLIDLVERNLISVSEQSFNGKIKLCRMGDVLWDLCQEVAKKEKFFHVTNRRLRGISGISPHRLSIQSDIELNCREYMQPTVLVRSLLSFDHKFYFLLNFKNFRLLRVMDSVGSSINDVLVQLLNLQYLACSSKYERLPASICKLQNLQTLIVGRMGRVQLILLPLELWKMTQLRHVELDRVRLPDPPSDGTEGENSACVLENLQSLSNVENFRCTEEVLERIPNVKKLGIIYEDEPEYWGYYCLNNLVRLHKLEELKIFSYYPSFLQYLTFPPSLKELTMKQCHLPWQEMMIIGSLPNLEVLKLKDYAFEGPVWETNEGEFPQLKYFLLENTNLEQWRADSIQFPRLERLVIKKCKNLKEIPSGLEKFQLFNP